MCKEIYLVSNPETYNFKKVRNEIGMNVLIYLGHQGLVRHFNSAIIAFSEKGHTVNVIIDNAKLVQKYESLDVIDEWQKYGIIILKDFPSLLISFPKSDLTALWRRSLNSLYHYLFYFKTEHPSKTLAYRNIKGMPKLVRWSMVFLTKLRPLSKLVDKKLTKKENNRTISTDLLTRLTSLNPDLIITLPLVWQNIRDCDLILAAKMKKIPVVSYVPSWDNFSTKGRIITKPDKIFTWNESLKLDAVKIHSCRNSEVEVVGAIVFDGLFEWKKTFKTQVLRDERLRADYVLYVCSSNSIIEGEIGERDESQLILKTALALKNSKRSKPIKLFIRSHPLGKLPDLREKAKKLGCSYIIEELHQGLTFEREGREDFYEQLAYSKAVIGLNTSAFMEAAILNKICISTADLLEKPKKTFGHLKHLRESKFIKFPHSVAEISNFFDEKENILNENYKTLATNFVKKFIRPNGIEDSASNQLVKSAENLLNPSDIKKDN